MLEEIGLEGGCNSSLFPNAVTLLLLCWGAAPGSLSHMEGESSTTSNGCSRLSNRESPPSFSYMHFWKMTWLWQVVFLCLTFVRGSKRPAAGSTGWHRLLLVSGIKHTDLMKAANGEMHKAKHGCFKLQHLPAVDYFCRVAACHWLTRISITWHQNYHRFHAIDFSAKELHTKSLLLKEQTAMAGESKLFWKTTA